MPYLEPWARTRSDELTILHRHCTVMEWRASNWIDTSEMTAQTSNYVLGSWNLMLLKFWFNRPATVSCRRSEINWPREYPHEVAHNCHKKEAITKRLFEIAYIVEDDFKPNTIELNFLTSGWEMSTSQQKRITAKLKVISTIVWI